jgi:hypothetical protein
MREGDEGVVRAERGGERGEEEKEDETRGVEELGEEGEEAAMESDEMLTVGRTTTGARTGVTEGIVVVVVDDDDEQVEEDEEVDDEEEEEGSVGFSSVVVSSLDTD